MTQEVADVGRSSTYVLWFVATAALLILAAVLTLAVAGRRFGRQSSAGLWVKPRTVDLTDKIVKEDQYVSGRFQISNPLNKPVVVKQLLTSCGCMGSRFEDGREPPISIGPGETAAFIMKGHTSARVQLVQRFYTAIVAECDGRKLPEASATLICRVEDPLKAYPDLIVLGSLPPDKPTRRKVVLATASPATKIEPARVSTTDPDSIQTQLVPNRADGLNGDGRRTHYDLDVTIVPRPGSDAISGAIIVIAGQDRLTIPVECTIKKPYRLTQKVVQVEGRPGEVVAREVFHEFSEPAWSAPRILRSPEGVDAEIAPFDASTKVVRMRVRVPDHSAAGTARVLTLDFEGRKEQIQVPIKVSQMP